MKEKEEVEVLMNTGVEMATESLEQKGKLVPFALGLTHGQEVRQIVPSSGVVGPELLELLEQDLASQVEAGELRAVAVFAAVRVQPEPGRLVDAIQAGLEHVGGYCVDVYFPYSFSEDGSLELGELFASRREPRCTGGY